MQGPPSAPIQFLRRELPIRHIFETAKSEGITSDQVVGIALEANLALVRLAFSSRRLDSAALYRLPPEAHPEIMTVLPLNVVTFLETTQPVDYKLKSVYKAIKALELIRDRNGSYPTPIYCAGRSVKPSCQYALTANKHFIRLHEIGKGGITSIRYDIARKRLIGIRVDTVGMGTSIVAMPYDAAMNRPWDMEDQNAWTDICTMPGTPLISLSKPCALGKNGRFYVNMAYDQRGILAFDDTGTTAHISVFRHASRIIGAPSYSNPQTVLQYELTPKGTEVQILPVRMGTNSPLTDAIL